MKKIKHNKLTFQQKRAAQYILLGLPIKKISKKLDTPSGTIRHWLYYNRRFNKYLTKLDLEFDTMISRQQKFHLKKVFKELLKIVEDKKSKRIDAKLKAIELYLRINRKFPQDQATIIARHEGYITQKHEGEIDINPEKLNPNEKDTLKRMLTDIRQLSGVN